MKNAFKLGFLALALSLTFAACGGSDKTAGGADSTATDTSVVDTTVHDSTVMDTTTMDTTTKM